ncbi:MAG: lipid-A-disaccharide synthase N-terminal domain-containing protein [Thermoanaerobaculia bacterium]
MQAGPGGFLEPLIGPHFQWFYRDSLWWTVFGLLGNFLFSSRFIIQWLHSEKKKELIVPPIFWHLSLWGSLISLVYGFHVDKLPVILGYLFLPFLYARNLMILYESRKRTTQS